MHLYSINIKPIYLRTNDQQNSTILDNIIPFGFPWHMKINITNYSLAKSGLSDSLTYATRKITDTEKYYFTKKIPTSTLNWISAYISNPNTATIINRLKEHSKHMWSQDEPAKFETSYQKRLREQRIIVYDGKLIILKPIFQNVRFISLIIVHTSLRENIFSHYHDSPTCGHMGESKSLFSLCLWFPWTSLQKN